MFEASKYQDILTHIQNILTDQRDMLDHYYYIKALNRTGKIQRCINYTTKILQEHDFELFDRLKLVYELIWSFHKTAEYEKAISLTTQSLKQIEATEISTLKIEHQKIYSSFVNLAGTTNYLIGEIQQAKKYFLKLLDLAEVLDNDNHRQGAKINLGLIYQDLGDYRMAMTNFTEALELAEQNSHLPHIKVACSNLSNLYNTLGFLDKADDMVLKTIKTSEQLDDSWGKAIALHIQGVIALKRGQTEFSRVKLNESLELMQEYDNPVKLSRTMFILLILYLDQKNRKESREILRQIKEKYEITNNQRVQILYNLGEAIYLKQSNVYRHKLNAEKKLRQIVNQNYNIESDYISLAYLNLVELLLEQLDSIEQSEQSPVEEEILQEVVDISDQIQKIAKRQDAPELQLQVFYIQANIFSLKLEFEKAQKLLDKASKIVEQWKLHHVTIDQPQITRLQKLPSEQQLKKLKGSVNRIIHTLPRLKIMIALHTHTKMTFTELRELLELSAGNLSNHCKKLIDADYLHKQKELVGDRFLSVYSLTVNGIREFKHYQSTIQPFLTS